MGSIAHAESPSKKDTAASEQESPDVVLAKKVLAKEPDSLAFLGEDAYEHGGWTTAVAVIEAIPLTERTAIQQLYLARSRAQLGLWLEALDDYEGLLAPQSPQQGLPGWQEQRSLAQAEGAALGRRLPWAKLDFGEAAPAGSSVFVDGHWVSPGRFQAPYPVNPGWHTFLLEIDGQILTARRMYFEEGQQRSVHLTHTTPTPLVAEPSPTVEIVAPGTGHTPEALALDDAPTGSWRIASYIGLGVGTVGVATAIGFSVDALMARQRLEDRCLQSSSFGDDCVVTQDEAQTFDRFRRSASVSDGALAVGVAGLVSGGIMWFLANREDKAARQSAGLTLQPFVGLDTVGLGGTF